MNYHLFKLSFNDTFECSPGMTLDNDSRIIVLSDLHMGDKGRRDDLLHNERLLVSLLEYYYANGFLLILNGDIIDLSKYRYDHIMKAWKNVIDIFARFDGEKRLVQILGNHDSGLGLYDYPFELLQSIRLNHNSDTLFVLHGHQASRLLTKTPYLSDFVVRFIARPLSIKNASARRSTYARISVERLIYKASREMRIVSLIGHTHRPLFDALSKYDNLRWTIEELFREYMDAQEPEKGKLAELIKLYRSELITIKKKDKSRISGSLYAEEDLLIPCLFNSGCATGKTGITCLEIRNDALGLVYWSGINKARPYMDREALERETVPSVQSPAMSEAMTDTSFIRYCIRRETLSGIFDRIALLSG